MAVRGERAGAARRGLARALGVLWILDGLLQLQPAMFTRAFVTGVLLPAAGGQPPVVAAVVRGAAAVWARDPRGFDLAAAALQLALGMGLAFGPGRALWRPAVWASLAWAVLVWVCGEGLGGLFTGSATFFAGAPGSALLYAVGAAVLLGPERWWRDGKAARALRGAVFGVLALAAVLQAVGPLWSPAGQAGLFQLGLTTPEPGWVRAPIGAVAHWAAAHAPVANGLWVLWMALVAAAWGADRGHPVVDVVAAVGLLAVWWWGQDFGVLGGLGTDPNSAPVLGVLMWAARRARRPDAPPVEPDVAVRPARAG